MFTGKGILKTLSIIWLLGAIYVEFFMGKQPGGETIKGILVIILSVLSGAVYASALEMKDEE